MTQLQCPECFRTVSITEPDYTEVKIKHHRHLWLGFHRPAMITLACECGYYGYYLPQTGKWYPIKNAKRDVEIEKKIALRVVT